MGLHTTGELAAAAAIVQAVVLFFALFYASKQLGEARKTREATLRPFVVVDLDADSPPQHHRTISNLGPIMARDVRFVFDPPLASSIYDSPPISELRLLKEGLDYLAPGKRIRLLFDFSPNRWNGGTLKPGLSQRHDVAITYRSALSTDGRVFEERTTLDLNLYFDTRYSRRATLTDVEKQLKELIKVLSGWSSSMPKGVRTVTPEAEQAAAETWRHEVEQRRRESGDRPPGE